MFNWPWKDRNNYESPGLSQSLGSLKDDYTDKINQKVSLFEEWLRKNLSYEADGRIDHQSLDDDSLVSFMQNFDSGYIGSLAILRGKLEEQVLVMKDLQMHQKVHIREA